ncbi:hypothetical protein ELAC_1806 [Estrella lausannensis]|uniref:Uncharacterized protein n=1 Tax=Estrella lausannensis TaxID=483423 RepID=A0A0H5DR33_9BACT|nr:hypothetical protein ELAC_1806 [Estrella lausannensis]
MPCPKRSGKTEYVTSLVKHTKERQRTLFLPHLRLNHSSATTQAIPSFFAALAAAALRATY